MTSDVETTEILVVGGGITGCAAARELANDRDVLVLERNQIAGDASGKASGLVTFSAQRSALPDAVRYAIEFFHSYDGSEHFEFTPRNGIELVPEGSEQSARSRVNAANDVGFELTYCDPDTVEERYPGVYDLSNYVGAIEYPDTGWVDPYTLTVSFQRDAEAMGAEFRTGMPVTDFLVEDGVIVGVETADGQVRASTVVVAAGWQTRDLVSDFVELPIRPFRYQTVNLRPDQPIDPETYPLGWDPVTGFYWRPEHDGELHVGGGEYLVEEPVQTRDRVKAEYRLSVATDIPDVLRGFDHADIASEDTCPTGDAATPDALPIIDSPPEVPDGMIIATGFHGYGIMESPIAGHAIRALVTDEDPAFPLAPYALDRFADRSPTFELVSLSEKREKHY